MTVTALLDGKEYELLADRKSGDRCVAVANGSGNAGFFSTVGVKVGFSLSWPQGQLGSMGGVLLKSRGVAFKNARLWKCDGSEYEGEKIGK
jgi:hypothetical protein